LYGETRVILSTEAKTVLACFFRGCGVRSQVVRVRLLVVIGLVIAFGIVGAGWKWQKGTQPKPQLVAGWSWDGSLSD
jgi:hypothetical protein